MNNYVDIIENWDLPCWKRETGKIGWLNKTCTPEFELSELE